QLIANGNISQQTQLGFAVVSPSISLTALGGNISADGSSNAGQFLAVNDGGLTVSLYVNATKVGANGGSILIGTSNLDSLQFANGTTTATPSHADVGINLN